MAKRGMVIIGAGETGARAAAELRDQGWAGDIVLIGKERFAPYERPPLSKSALISEGEPSPAWILDENKLKQQRIDLIAGRRAVRIHAGRHAVELEDGSEVPYERLLLAVGARPRRLTLEGSDLSGALYLRTFDDALALRAVMRPEARIAVIGAGFIGLETAASARTRGCAVTVIEAGPRILMRGVPEPVAAAVEARHREAGVDFRLGAGLAKVERLTDGYRIALADGAEVRCDALVIGIGAVPETELAAESGLATDNGIAVDGRLATGDPDIFAAGDCCSFPHPLYDGKRIRLEAWRNAQDQGTHAALNMLGADKEYAVVPWFWSDQYELVLQVAGLTHFGETVVKRELPGGDALFFHLAGDGRLVAASAVGSPSIAKDIRLSEMLIERRAAVDPAQLADANVKLKAVLQQHA